MWKKTQEYSAMIGGVLYKNVANPIVVNGKSLISLSRNKETGTLGVSLEIYNERNEVICSVFHNEVRDLCKGFLCLRGFDRVSVINEHTGQVFLDLSWGITEKDYELDLSFLCVLFGYPLVLHPERTKLGAFNDGNQPNMSKIIFAADKIEQCTAIVLNNSKIYLLCVCIKNLENGLIVNIGKNNEAN